MVFLPKVSISDVVRININIIYVLYKGAMNSPHGIASLTKLSMIHAKYNFY